MSAALDIASRVDRIRDGKPIARARAVAPIIAANADRIEADRCLPPEVLDALHGAALFRTLLPRAFDGEEVEPAAYVQMMEVLAEADASAAWCVGQASGCSMAAAYMKPDAARRIWGDDPRAVLAWGAGLGVAKVVDGGYLVTGTWQFASGGRHATWIGGHCKVEERDGSIRKWPGGAQVEHSMLFPAGRVAMTDAWQVMGLRGTGSDTYSVSDLFAPEDETVIRDVADLRRERGSLYRFTTTNMYASGFAGVALGIARGALAGLIALASEKTPTATTRAMRESGVVQSRVAYSEAKLQAARALLFQTLREVYAEVADGRETTLDQRMKIRMSATFATHQAKEVVDAAYHEAGATAIFNSNPFERRFRDINCVTQQVQARFSHFETIGAHMLGLSPSLRFI